MRNTLVVLATLGALSACSDDSQDVDTDPVDLPTGLPVLGAEGHTLNDVDMTAQADGTDGLRGPRALAFNPDRPRELWVLNRSDDSTTRIYDAGTADQTTDRILDPYALHFQEEASSLAFGRSGEWASCHESANTYNGQGSPNYFMGPSLWSSELDVYAYSNPEAVEYLTNLFGYPVDLGSHLDMLHETPFCMGIAWQSENTYWAFDGHNSSISLVDFKIDHGAGFDDHSDGHVIRYGAGQVSRVKDVPSHMVFGSDGTTLYFADTGNNRIAALDTTSGTAGNNISSRERYPVHRYQDDANLWTVIDGANFSMGLPSGLIIRDGIMYVADNDTGIIHGFSMESVEAGAPEQIDYLDTEIASGNLMGIEMDVDGNLWIADFNNRVLRIAPKG